MLSRPRRIITCVRFSIPGAIAGACTGVDRTLINVFRSTAEAAIYNACFLASVSVAPIFWLIVSANFFPCASKSNDRAAIFVKRTKAVPCAAVSLVPLFALVEKNAFPL